MKKHLTLLLLLPGFACFAQKFELVLNLKKDSTYSLKSTNTLQINQTIQGQQVDVSTTITGNISHKVVAMHDSVYSMEVRYVSMHMLVNAMGNTIDFNSEGTGDGKPDPTGMGGMMTKMLKGMTNKPFYMELSKTGHILSVKGVDALFEGMFGDLPQLTAEQKAQFKSQMDKSFGETSIKNSFQMTFPTFPVQKVAVNDKWTGSTMMQSTVTARINTTYTLNQVTDKAYLVTGDGIIAEDKNSGPVITNGMTTSFTGLSGKVTTDYVFDKHTGWILSSKTKETLSGNVDVKTPTGQEMTYPIALTADFSVLP